MDAFELLPDSRQERREKMAWEIFVGWQSDPEVCATCAEQGDLSFEYLDAFLAAAQKDRERSREDEE